MSSCFGFRKSKGEDTEALLPQYQDDTILQRSLHQKMHSYQMVRALSKGYMPSTEQLIVNLRTLLASDVLNPDNPDLSDSGRLLIKYSKQWLTQFIEMLRHKNDEDQIQDFMWFLSKSRVSVDTDDLAKRASKVKSRADATAAYESLRTVGSLLLTNSDFRLFLGDLNVIGRQVFADTAFSLSEAAKEAGNKLEPSEQDKKAIQEPGSDEGPKPTTEDLGNEVADVSKIVTNGLVKTGHDAVSSAKENISGDQKDTLLYRLKQAVLKLRKRNDYSDSVSTIGLLIKRYAKAYSRAVDHTISAAQDDVDTNPELDRAVKNFWSLMSSFGDRKQWEMLEQKVKKVMEHSQQDPEFENLMGDVGNSVEKLLSDPDFFESADRKIQELREKAKNVGSDSSLRKHVDEALEQFQITFKSVVEDPDVNALIATTGKILNILSPTHAVTNSDLIQDSLHVFVPLLIQTIQYIPIPRLEVSVPEIDLLLENLIIEPGRTVNNTSFLPYKLRIETYNDLEIRKAKFRTTSSITSLVTIKVDGLSIRAEEIGFWLRAHSGILRLADEGIASFALDERGIDIHMDVEIGKEKLEKILTLKAVRVHVHKLTYTLRKSKFSWLAWLIKPMLRPIVRKVLEKQLATAIADGIHAANRELLFARERLRATRISDPQDVRTFIKAVITRLTPEEDPDVYTAVGVTPSKGVFNGVYAPGSVVKVWEEEGRRAGEVVDDNAAQGWRNEIFDVQATMMGQ
ncbi:MAG: bactericidal permeability-increasing [Lasallia pustulata]|uniref:Bactericidal permeability-increasing n=1 Tax=Lasallia pustulata TaxID=136370 RepID=A0A5M8PWE3_9LECA|nr:MAG: bactericidal permeability-increasing [Lasallia pustulata]